MCIRDSRSIESLIFLGYCVKVYIQPLGQLSDRDAHAARAKVVAAFYHLGEFPVPEQPLQLALGQRIAFLYLGAAFFNGFFMVRLGRACRAAAAVASRASADEHDKVPLHRTFTNHLLCRSGSDDSCLLYTSRCV